ncbi:hypothetical protein FEM48_Zijuj07G0111900 [Ziziphus jujuba var. spinosa]|uniref:Uncharacterized protein n=1 Tax=Ziziphus jujuba var. spinosa TaxID=714518 RepID=A0A978V4A5_ZIZJJ|nr:hypothetical protein FEM48_Zijuj07G0111900 [Ziziphus jujuba var. spinosa]
MVFDGMILEGIVYTVLKAGVFLQYGPLDFEYLSSKKMPHMEIILFFNDKWIEEVGEFQTIVSMNGHHHLGPAAKWDISHSAYL